MMGYKMNIWIKNTKGEKSASLTLVIIAFVVMMSWLVVSIFADPIGIVVPAFDASEAMMVLTPLLGLYWGRRNTDVKEKALDKPNN